MSQPGLYDPTTIMNADQLNKAVKEGWIKLAFYLISFFYYLYRYKIEMFFDCYVSTKVSVHLRLLCLSMV